MLAGLISLGLVLFLYSQWGAEKRRADHAERLLDTANKKIAINEIRLKKAAALDMKYTTELRDAQNSISELRQRVESGAERLRIAATCHSSLPGVQRSASMDDAGSPRLSEDAQQAYFTLREQIATSEKMIRGLQQYIQEQCLR